MVQEVWRAIKGYEELYEVSNQGRVRSLFRAVHALDPRGVPGIRHYASRILKATPDVRGYLHVNLSKQGKTFCVHVHKLVLQTFAPPKISPELECRHLDGVKENNRIQNLIWGTCKENTDDKRLHGAIPMGEKHCNAKLTEEDVIYIRTRCNGLTNVFVADMFNVNKGAIRDVKKRITWKHI